MCALLLRGRLREFIRRRHNLDLAVTHIDHLALPIRIYSKLYIVTIVIPFHSFFLMQDISLSCRELLGQLMDPGIVRGPFVNNIAVLIDHLEHRSCQGLARGGIGLLEDLVGWLVFHIHRDVFAVMGNRELHIFRYAVAFRRYYFMEPVAVVSL